MICLKSHLTLLLLLLAAWSTSAQPMTFGVSGYVGFGAANEPANAFPVWIYTNEERLRVLTNEEGIFSARVQLTPDANGQDSVTVEVFDLCTGMRKIQRQTSAAGDTSFADFNFTICEATAPPNNSGCGAFFAYQPDEEAPQTIRFQNLSYSADSVTSWRWDFGDGATSNEYNPVHTYESNGIYTVQLQLLAETDNSEPCRARYATNIVIRDTSASECPTTFEPVCVATPSGGFIRFANRCLALAEGFTEDMLVPCVEDCMCPAVFEPVCVRLDDGTVRRFVNRCEAACEGFGADDFVDCENGEVCSEIFDPVCVISNGEKFRYTNACYAIKAGFDEADFVPCENACDCPTDEYIPVCVALPSGEIREYVSACWAKCDGFTEEDFIDCENSCICPEIFDPVCVVSASDTLRFANRCFAACEGYGSDQIFQCRPNQDCNCPRIYEPICVEIDGAIREFPNTCVAACYGYTPEDFVDCDSGACICPEYYDPVCAVVDGDTLTFDNICFARCEGFTADQLLSCRPGSECNCPLIYAPVCVVSASGEVVEYSNRCFAACAGFSEADFVTCPSPEPSCQAMFFFRQNENDMRTFQFEDLSMGEIVSWKWDFGDGVTSTQRNPTHTFSYDGIFYVRLSVRTNDGCESQANMVVYVNPDAVYDNACNALFIPFIFSDSLQVLFRNISSMDAIEYRWDFGDGNTSTERSPTHTYATSGIYEVSLTVGTADGCTNTFEGIINLESQNFTGAPAFRPATTTSTNTVVAFESLRLYPNPVQESMMLEFTMPKAASYQLSIYTLEGKVLRSTSQDAISGTNNIQLAVDELPTGMYLLRIQSHEQAKVVKFVKQ